MTHLWHISVLYNYYVKGCIYIRVLSCNFYVAWHYTTVGQLYQNTMQSVAAYIATCYRYNHNILCMHPVHKLPKDVHFLCLGGAN